MTEALSSLGVFGLALLPLVGVWLGQRLQSRTGHEAWLRDKRLEVYVEVLEFLREYPSSSLELGRDDPDHADGVSATLQGSRKLLARYGGLAQRVRLLGPAEVARLWDVATGEAEDSRRLRDMAIAAPHLPPELAGEVPRDDERAQAHRRAIDAQLELEHAMQRVLRGESWWRAVRRRLPGERRRDVGRTAPRAGDQ